MNDIGCLQVISICFRECDHSLTFTLLFLLLFEFRFLSGLSLNSHLVLDIDGPYVFGLVLGVLGRHAHHNDAVLLQPETPHLLVKAAHIQIPQFETSCNAVPRIPVSRSRLLDVEDVCLVFDVVGNEILFVVARIFIVVQHCCCSVGGEDEQK